MSACDKNQNLAPNSTGKLVTDLRVNELKSELEKRGLDSQGVKVVLTVRLNKALRQEGYNPEQYVFYTKAMSSTADNNASSVEPSEGSVRTDESQSSVDILTTTTATTTVVDDSQDLRIIDDSQEANELQKTLETASSQGENVKVLPSVEIKKEILDKEDDEDVVILEPEKKLIKNEPVTPEKQAPEVSNESGDVKESTELQKLEESQKLEDPQEHNELEELNYSMVSEETEDPEEQAEGEDEFEEVEEEDEEPKVDEHKPIASSGLDHDELYLDDEDLLEDPLDEQPLEEQKKEAPTTSTKTITPASRSPKTSSFLFADDAKKTSIWIRGIAPATKASSVKQLASQFGKVVQSKIFNSKPINGEIKNCFAFVTFSDPESMDAAIAALHRKDHQGRTLRVEKVAESHLTGSAERIAKEKKDVEEKKRETEKKPVAVEKNKRAVIQAPEDSKRKERQTIQAPEKSKEKVKEKHQEKKPEKKSNRAIIQPPDRDDHRRKLEEREKERARRDRKPIVYKMSPGEPARLIIDGDDDDRGKSSERDSRRTISAAAPRRTISPLRTSRAVRGGAEQPSLIISARVDTSGCRGAPKRSVERHVPVGHNITTSQLRRNQIYVDQPSSSPPRASYQTQQYAANSRGDVRGGTGNYRGADSRREVQDYRVTDRRVVGSGDRRGAPGAGVASYRDPPSRHSSSSSVPAPSRDRYQEPRQLRRPDARNADKPTARELEMLEMIKRKEEEHKMREEKLEMAREREKMKFEAEKLERAKLEIALSQQRLALQTALLSETRGSAAASSRAPAGHGAPLGALGGVGSGSSGSSRRRQADHLSPPPVRSAKVHSEDRTSYGSRGRSGNVLGRQSTTNSSVPSARHVATAYGIQASANTIGGSSATSSGRGGSTNVYGGSATKDYDHQRDNYSRSGQTASVSAYNTSSALTGGYQSGGYSGAYATEVPGFQSQVWNGYDSTEHIGTNWTAAGASASSSAASTTTWPQQQYSSTTSSARHNHNHHHQQRDYNNYGRNNY